MLHHHHQPPSFVKPKCQSVLSTVKSCVSISVGRPISMYCPVALHFLTPTPLVQSSLSLFNFSQHVPVLKRLSNCSYDKPVIRDTGTLQKKNCQSFFFKKKNKKQFNVGWITNAFLQEFSRGFISQPDSSLRALLHVMHSEHKQT